MTKKPERNGVKENFDVHMWTEYLPAQRWYGVLTFYEGQKPVYMVEAVEWNAAKLLALLGEAHSMVQAGLADHNLVLPDMGDWQVRYFSTK